MTDGGARGISTGLQVAAAAAGVLQAIRRVYARRVCIDMVRECVAQAYVLWLNAYKC